MKQSISLDDIQTICKESDLVGLALQKVVLSEMSLQLGFWSHVKRQMTWLTAVVDDKDNYLFATTDKLPLAKKQKKPLSLFIEKHGLNAVVKSFEISNLSPWNLELSLMGEQGELKIELNLSPSQGNIGAHLNGKSVWFKKPNPPVEVRGKQPARGGSEYYQKVWAERFAPPQVKVAAEQVQAQTNPVLKRKKAALGKVRAQIEAQREPGWEQAGELLKERLSLESIPQELARFIDPAQTLSWNIENCFVQMKKNKRKQAGTLKREQELLAEIAKMSQLGNQPEPVLRKQAKPESLLKMAEAKGRTVHIDELVLYLGKSGADNLRLLRQAKAWYLWFHVRDYPGTFGILKREKNQNISLSSVEQAAKSVVLSSIKGSPEGKFDVLYTECRFVRPIKGAKAGQVTYSHEKVITVRV